MAKLIYVMFLVLQVEPMETEENIDLNEEDQVRMGLISDVLR